MPTHFNSPTNPSNVPPKSTTLNNVHVTEQNEAKSEQPDFAVEITRFTDYDQDEVYKWLKKYINLEIELDAFKEFFKEYDTNKWVKSEGALRVCQSIVNLLVEEGLDFGLTLDKYKRVFLLFCDCSTIAPTDILPELLQLMDPLIAHRNIIIGDYLHYVETPAGFWIKHRNVCLMLMIGFECSAMKADRYTRFQMFEYISWIIQGDKTVQSETEFYAVMVVQKIAIKYGLLRQDIIKSMVRLLNLLENNETGQQFDTFKHQTGHCARFCIDNFQFDNFNEAILETKVIFSPDQRSVRCIIDRPVTVHCPFKVSTGTSYYFEVTLITAGQMRIGWSPVETFNEQIQLGVSRNSIAIDGYNRQIWHNWKSHKMIDLPSWKAGDVIGCFIDKRNYTFYLNGKQILYNLTFSFSPPYFAAVTLFSEQQCEFNFGEKQLRSRPPNYSTVENVQNYLHNSLVIPERKIEHFNDNLQSSVDEAFKKWLMNTGDILDTTQIATENKESKSESKNCIFTFKNRISTIQNRLFQSVINLVKDETNLHEFKIYLFKKFEFTGISFISSEIFELIENQIEYFNVHRNCLVIILCENIEDLYRLEYLTKILEQNGHMETILYALRIILLKQTLSQLNQKWIERIQNALLPLLKQFNARKLFNSNPSTLISKLPSSIKDFGQISDLMECVQNIQFNYWDNQYALEYQICLCVIECLTRLHESVAIECKPAQYRRAMLSNNLLLVGMDNIHANSVPIRSIFEIVSGVYYFEVMLLSNGPMRIGYISNKIDNDDNDNKLVRMIGEDKYSIGLDLYHKCIWYDNKMTPITNMPDYKCKVGDVVGFTIDACKGNLIFYVNGTLIEFNSCCNFQILLPGPYYAATSLELFQYCAFNFGQLPFKLKLQCNFKDFHSETNGERRRYCLILDDIEHKSRLTKTQNEVNGLTNQESFSPEEIDKLDEYFRNISLQNHRDINVRNLIVQHTRILNDHRKIQLLDSVIKHFGENVPEPDAIEPIIIASHFDMFNIKNFDNVKILENFIYDAIAQIHLADHNKYRERNTWIVIWILFTNRDISKIIPENFLCCALNETSEPVAQLVALLFLERYTKIEKMNRHTIKKKLIELSEYFDRLPYSPDIDLLSAQIGLCARVLLDRATPCESKIKTLEKLGGTGDWILQSTECPLFVSGRSFFYQDHFYSERANQSTILFYEIILLTGGYMTVGWQALHRCPKKLGFGISSRKVDFSRKSLRTPKNDLSLSETTVNMTNMDTWKAKDVVGCLIDTTKNCVEFKFYLNGKIMKFENYKEIMYENLLNYRAYICLAKNQQVIVNFGLTAFLYPPKGVQYEPLYESISKQKQQQNLCSSCSKNEAKFRLISCEHLKLCIECATQEAECKICK